MAYMNFSDTHGVATLAPAAMDQETTRTETARLTALEWSVVALARKDSIASLASPGRVSMALGALFGVGRNPRLADARLEALRRMAVLAWHHGYAVPAREIAAFIAAGFSADHYETLLASISNGRVARRLA